MKKFLNISLCWILTANPAFAQSAHTDHYDYYSNFRVNGTAFSTTTIIEGTAGAGYLEMAHQSSDTGTPGSGSNAVRLFAKTKKLYTVTDDGGGTPVVAVVGGGSVAGTGEINYITESTFEDNAFTGWVTYQDAINPVPTDATGGSPTVTFAVNSTTPLDGVYDAVFTKDAANRQGEGVAYAFKLPPAYRGQMNKINIAYRTTANYNSATEGVSVFIWNVDTGVAIYPNGYSESSPPRLPHNLSGGSVSFGWVPTNTTDDNYRIVFHTGLTGTSAWNLYVDDIVTGPGMTLSSSIVTTPVAYTPPFSDGFGTIASPNFMWWREGKMLHVAGTFTVGTTNANEAEIAFPAGLTSASTSTIEYAGKMSRQATGAVVYEVYREAGLTYFTFGRSDGSLAGLTKRAGSNLVGTGSVISFQASCPIVEWSSPTYIAGANINSPAKAGFIQPYAGATAPKGWMIADGSEISRTTYAQLFANIGTTWGVGDNSTTFNIPDLRGVFAKGAGTTSRTAGKDAMGNYYAGTLGAYLTDKSQGHIHDIDPPNTVSGGPSSIAHTHSANGASYVLYDGSSGMASGNSGGSKLYAFGATGAVVDGGIASHTHSTNIVKFDSAAPKADGTNGTVRVGLTTEPQSASVTYIIKLYDDLQAPSVGFSVARVGVTGLVNNETGNTAGTPIKGATDAADASFGYVGQVITFTGTVGSTTNSWRSASTGTSIPAGTWMIFPNATAASTALMTGMYTLLSDNAISDGSTGVFTNLSTNYYAQTGYEISGPMHPVYFKTSTSVLLYVKAWMLGAAPNPVISGFAMRIR